MKTYFYSVSLLLAGILASCQSGNDDEIDTSVPFYQDLGVEYNVTQGHTHVGANFNKNNADGANLRLPDGAILFNDKTPDFLNTGTYFYKLSFPGLEAVAFTFTRSSDQVYVNKTSFENAIPIIIPQSFAAINASGTTTLTWEGAPIAQNEYVQIHLEYEGGVYDITNRSVGSTSISLNFTNPTSANEATLYLSRVTTYPLQQSNGNAGGQIDVSYVQNKTVAIQ